VTSDTKYDRAYERSHAKADEIALLRTLFDQLAPAPHCQRLVLGSAYHREVEILLEALLARTPTDTPWQIIIAPHIVSQENVEWISRRCREAGFAILLYSELSKTKPTLSTATILIIDVLGILAEVYGTAEAAFVGGALHHQVHNVLEPASHGLALAFGPFYKNSQEAIRLVDSGLAAIVGDSRQFAAWWRQLDQEHSELNGRMMASINQLTGASDRIFALWRPLLEP
jgi:3-deoxy-D-manno-octulosonic-acid transferase